MGSRTTKWVAGEDQVLEGAQRARAVPGAGGWGKHTPPGRYEAVPIGTYRSGMDTTYSVGMMAGNTKVP